MNIEEAREYCLSITGAEESMPFGDTVLVYKVMDKIFALLGLEPRADGFSIRLKCEPEKAILLREEYTGITAGYNLNKKHWNTVYLNVDVPDETIQDLIHHSVNEIIQKLSKKDQEKYHQLVNNI